METNKLEPFSADLSVKKVEFRTGQKGDIFLLAHLNETKELKKNNINALIFNDLDKRLVLGKGARVYFEFDEQHVPKIKRIIKEPKVISDTPKFCTSCGAKLEGVDAKLKCPNYFCPATSRGFLYKLINLAVKPSPDRYSMSFIKFFLDKYIYQNTIACADNPTDFKIMFFSISDKNIKAREDQWIKHHGDKGKDLWNLEVEIQTYLKSEYLPARDFWEICNFPAITGDTLEQMAKINPKDLLEGKLHSEHFIALDNHAKRVIRDNLDFVDFLNKFFEDFGEKTWLTSKN
jgi:hypothetical protein